MALSRQQEVGEVVNVQESARPPSIPRRSLRTFVTPASMSSTFLIPPPAMIAMSSTLSPESGVYLSGQPHIAGAETYQTMTGLDGLRCNTSRQRVTVDPHQHRRVLFYPGPTGTRARRIWERLRRRAAAKYWNRP